MGILAAIFDFSFTKFATSTLVKVSYLFALAIYGLLALCFIVYGFNQNTGDGLLMLLVVAPIVFLYFTLCTRIVLEIVIVVFRMAEIASQDRRAL